MFISIPHKINQAQPHPPPILTPSIALPPSHSPSLPKLSHPFPSFPVERERKKRDVRRGLHTSNPSRSTLCFDNFDPGGGDRVMIARFAIPGISGCCVLILFLFFSSLFFCGDVWVGWVCACLFCGRCLYESTFCSLRFWCLRGSLVTLLWLCWFCLDMGLQ